MKYALLAALVFCPALMANADSLLVTSFDVDFDDNTDIYTYSYDIEWELSQDISHWLLRIGCAHDTIGSISDGGDVIWPDHNQNPFDNWAVKWDFEGAESGSTSGGTFWFESTMAPRDPYPDRYLWENYAAAKHGQNVTFGDLDGFLPQCIPEPSAISLAGPALGLLFLLRRK